MRNAYKINENKKISTTLMTEFFSLEQLSSLLKCIELMICFLILTTLDLSLDALSPFIYILSFQLAVKSLDLVTRFLVFVYHWSNRVVTHVIQLTPLGLVGLLSLLT